MWLVYRERTDGCTILHARNDREFRPQEFPILSVNGFCPETKTVYEFLGCFYHGDTCQPFRDVNTLRGDTLAERYEKTMARLQQLTSDGNTVEVVWDYQFDMDLLSHNPELKQHPIVECDALYGGRTESMVLHYKIDEGETIQYYNVMSLYHYVCKYFKFPLGHAKIHVGDACRDKQVMLGMEGLIKCTVLSPRRLYHPVLLFMSVQDVRC